MGTYTGTDYFSIRTLFQLVVNVETSQTTGGTILRIRAYAQRTGTESRTPYGTGSRSYSVPGAESAPGINGTTSATLSWSYDWRNGDPQSVWTYPNYFTRFIPSSYGNSTNVTITASGSSTASTNPGSASVTVNVPLFANVTVPNVIGQNQSTAVNNIQSAGLSASTQPDEAGATSSNNGTVKSQSPSGGSSVASGSNVTLTVYNYVPPTYTTFFNSNGGSINPSSQSVTAGNSISLPSPGTRTNYSFLGWLVGGTYRGVGYNYFPTSSTTLTAYWQALTWTVTYSEQGGTNVSNATVTRGSSVTLPNISRDGFNLLGWYTSSSGGTRVGTSGQSYTPFNNVTLYAQWEEAVPGFVDQSVTSALLINEDISTTANSSVSATNATSYAIEYSGSDLNPTAWLSIDNSGNLSGSTSDVGTYSFRIAATGAGGTTNSTTQTITVTYPGQKFIQGDAFAPISSIRRFNGFTWEPVSFVKRWNGTSWEDASN